MIRFEKVSHEYGRGTQKVRSLRDVSLEIGDEFIVGFDRKKMEKLLG